MSGLGCLITEFYFVPQVWRISKKNYILAGLITIATLGQFASTLTTFIRTSQQLDIIDPGLTVQMGPTLTSQQVFASISNTLISGSLIYFNWGILKDLVKNHGWFEAFLTASLDYATLAGALQFVYLAVYLAFPSSFLSLPYQVATGKLLVNALLAQLNARDIGKKGRRKTENPNGYYLTQMTRPIDVPMGVLQDGQESVMSPKATLAGSETYSNIERDIERQENKL